MKTFTSNEDKLCYESNILKLLGLVGFSLIFIGSVMRSNIYNQCWVFQAFKKAWEAACSSQGSVLVVPKNNYLLKPITFEGPCKSSITVQVRFHHRSHFLQTFKQLFLINVYSIKWLMIFFFKKKPDIWNSPGIYWSIRLQ